MSVLNSLVPVALGSAPVSVELRHQLDTVLTSLVADASVDETVRRAAEQVQALSAVSPRELEAPTSPRRVTAYLKYVTVSGSILLRDLATIAVGLVTSMIGITAATSWVSSEFFGEAGRWALVTGISVVWTTVYAIETLDNYPLTSWRRSERQDVHTLTAPFAPYMGADGLERTKAILGWPLSVLLPWVCAIALSLGLHELLGSSRDLVFYLVFGVLTLGGAATYLATEL